MMSNKKTRLLFLSKHAVHAQMAMAGNQFFYHTLLSFANDARFEIGLLTAQKRDADFEAMRKALESKATNFSIAIPKMLTFFTYLFYNTGLRNILSTFRADWYYLDPIYRYYFKKAISSAKKSGFDPDVIILEWTEVLFLESYCQKLFPKAKLVVTEHDVSFTKLERRFQHSPKWQKKIVEPFKKRELEDLHQMDLVRVLSIDDRNTLTDNGIENEKIRVVAPFFQNKNLSPQAHIKKQVVFYGALNRSENVEAVQWFINQVFIPFSLKQWVKFVVIGGGNAKLKEKYKETGGVHFTGFVVEPSEIFAESLCMVVPLINGGGIKIKVLEGMTCSLPILTNDIGMEGIGGENGLQYMHCQTPKQYESAIQQLIKQPELRVTIGENARKWINEHFDYQKDLDDYKTELLTIRKKQ